MQYVCRPRSTLGHTARCGHATVHRHFYANAPTIGAESISPSAGPSPRATDCEAGTAALDSSRMESIYVVSRRAARPNRPATYEVRPAGGACATNTSLMAHELAGAGLATSPYSPRLAVCARDPARLIIGNVGFAAAASGASPVLVCSRRAWRGRPAVFGAAIAQVRAWLSPDRLDGRRSFSARPRPVSVALVLQLWGPRCRSLRWSPGRIVHGLDRGRPSRSPSRSSCFSRAFCTGR